VGNLLQRIVVDCSIKVLILVCVDRIVDGSNSNNLVEVIINASLKGGRLTTDDALPSP
jgi:hypothetical protein